MLQTAGRQRIARTFTVRSGLLSVLLACVVLLGFGCGPDASTSRETEAAGADTLRLAVLSPAFADTLRTLGYEERIVARHGYDQSLPELPALGDNLAIDYEVLASIRPDVLVMEDNATPTPPRLASLSERLEIRIERVPSLTLDDVRASIVTLDTIARGVDAGEPSQAALDLAAAFDAAFEPLTPEAIERVGAVAPMLGGTAILGPGSFHHELLLRLGVRAAPETGAPYIRVDAADVAALSPDTILLLTSEPGDTSELLGRVGELDIPAIRDGRVVVVEFERVLQPSVALIETARLIRQALEQDGPAS